MDTDIDDDSSKGLTPSLPCSAKVSSNSPAKKRRRDSRTLVDMPDSPFLLQSSKDSLSKVPPSSSISASAALLGKSDIASRVASFLPLLQSANEELERKIKEEGKDSVNVEVIDPEAPEVIKFNLLLGVLQPKDENIPLLPSNAPSETSSLNILLPHQSSTNNDIMEESPRK